MTVTARLQQGDVVHIRGERWRVVGMTASSATPILHVVGCDSTNTREAVSFLLPFEAVQSLNVAATPRLVAPRRWRHVARRALADALPSWTALRAAASAHLMLIPFQLEPALALTRGDACRFLIADDVGLGKTVQAGLMIAETLHRRPDGRVIIVSPAGLRDQWEEELRNRFDLPAQVLDAPRISRISAGLPADVNPWAVHPVVIVSIDYIKRPEVMRALETLIWDIVVFDEAHNLAAHSVRAAAADRLAERARAVVMLTATPHSGDDAAFNRLCSLGTLGSSDRLVMFRRNRALRVAGDRRTTFLRVRPTPAEAAMHQALMSYVRLVWSQSDEAAGSGPRLAACVLARRSCSSANSLARSLERRLALLDGTKGRPFNEQVALPFTDAAAADAEPDILLQYPGLRDASDEHGWLQRLLTLARTAASAESKLDALRRLISRTRESVLIFTEYRDTLAHVASILEDHRPVQLHGALTARERADVLASFTEGPARILIATDAAAEGLNLHHRCRLVVNLELPWTPSRLEQRIGRVDRMGQSSRVHAINLLAAETYEESTLARLIRRMQRVRATLRVFVREPDDRAVAERIFGESRRVDDDHPIAIPDAVVTLDLGRDAEREALRLARARAFMATCRDASTDRRAVIARLRSKRRDGNIPRQCLWLFRVAFADDAGRVVSESLLPLRAALTASPPKALTRAVLNVHNRLLEPVLRSACETLRTSFQDSMGPPVARWTERERQIIEALRARHARLSAGLLQPGLFDRRQERATAAQNLILDRTLAQASARLADLADCRTVRVDRFELVFGAVLA